MTRIWDYIKNYYHGMDNFERRLLEIGIILGIIFSCLMLILGIAIIPFSGGVSLPVALAFLNILYVVFSAAVWGASFKYVGRAIDTVIAMWKGEEVSNQQLAVLGGCFVGLVLAIATVCVPLLPIISIPHLGLVEVIKLIPWQQMLLTIVGMVGAMASLADKIGQFWDVVFRHTIISLWKSFQQTAAAKSIREGISEYLWKVIEDKKGRRWERLGVSLGIIVGVIVAIILIALGIAAVPLSGGVSSIGLLIGLHLIYVLLSAAIWGTSLKYIGRAIDTIADIRKEGMNNQRLAGLCGCVVGLGLAILMIFVPLTPVIILPQFSLIQAAALASVAKALILLLCMPSFVASAADKLGQWLDTKTKKPNFVPKDESRYTVLDLCSWGLRKTKQEYSFDPRQRQKSYKPSSLTAFNIFSSAFRKETKTYGSRRKIAYNTR
jgi:hypothetical protein